MNRNTLMGTMWLHDRVIATICVIAVTCPCSCLRANESSSENTNSSQGEPAYEEVLKLQALGRIVLAPDASYFLFEWSRPASHLQDGKIQMQTLLYKVLTPNEWGPLGTPQVERLFQPEPGATYHLGSLSPDSMRVSFSEVDWDENKVRVGVVPISGAVPAHVTWLSLPPDETRLSYAPVWISNEELMYSLKSGLGKVARAEVASGKADPCMQCQLDENRSEPKGTPSRAAQSQSAFQGLPTSAKGVALSKDGSLGVYVTDSPEMLGLYFVKNEQPVTLFENSKNIKSGAADSLPGERRH